jgi:hypothetical protein
MRAMVVEVIKAVHRGNPQQKYVHYMAMIGNQVHRPLLFADLVPRIFIHLQRQLVLTIERNPNRRSAVKHGLFQVGGLRAKVQAL